MCTIRVCVPPCAHMSVSVYVRLCVRVWWIQKRVITRLYSRYAHLMHAHMKSWCGNICEHRVNAFNFTYLKDVFCGNMREWAQTSAYHHHLYTSTQNTQASERASIPYCSRAHSFHQSLARRSCASVVYLWILLFQIMRMKMLVCFAAWAGGGVAEAKISSRLGIERVAAKFT